MSIPQGFEVVNTQYFTLMTAVAANAKSCAELQSLNLRVNLSVGGTLGAISTQISAVETTATNLENDLTNLAATIATLTGSQTAFTALETLPALAAGVSDLGSAIAYIQAEANLLGPLGTTNTLTFIKTALQLAGEVTSITRDYNLLQRQITNLTTQFSTVTSLLSSFNATIESSATRFPGCTIP